MTEQKSFGQLLRDAWEVYTAHFVFFLVVILVLTLPINLITAYTAPKIETASITTSANVAPQFVFENGKLVQKGGTLPVVPKVSAAYRIANILSLCLHLLAGITIILGVTKALKKEKPDPMNTTKEAAHLWPRVFLTALLYGIFTFLLTLLLVIPGLIYGIFWMFAIPAVVLSGKKNNEALKYSHELLRGRWWQAFGRMIALSIPYFIIFMVLIALMGASFGANAIVQTIFMTIIEVLAVFASVFSVLYFLDLERVHAEGGASTTTATTATAE